MKPAVFTVFVAIASAAAVAAPSPSGSTVKKSIQAIYARQDTAVARKDVDGALYGCARDYQEIHTEPGVRGMSFTLTQLRPMLQSTLTLAHWVRRSSVIQKIALMPGGAKVTVKQHLILLMPAPKVHKEGKVLIDSLSSDTWVQEKGGWQEKKSVVLSGRTQVSLHEPAGEEKAGTARENTN